MRTKHLFYTMALAGIFAACTNDEFLENGAPQASVEGQERPTISNVTLNIEEGDADTRVSWNGGFKFEKGDVISALLMDENNTGIRYGVTTNTDEWNKLTWLEKYHLVDYVHTNFPFEYDGTGFNSNCNMLEGNYFLTYPYVCLDGNRQGRIDIANQVQLGNTQESRIQALEKNQRFIGYAQLLAGEGVSDFKAQLVPILAPVRIAIKNETGVGELEVTKLVISHSKLTGTLMVDPTRANYSDPMINEKGGWNLWQEYVQKNTDALETEEEGDIWHFNYANYLENQPATAAVGDWEKELYYNGRYGSLNDYDYVYNVKGEAGNSGEIRKERKPNTYYWDDAIRAAVQPMREFNNPEYATQYIELKLGEGSYDENGKPVFTQEYLTLKKSEDNSDSEGDFIEALVMLPAFQGDEEPLMLTIYTNQGIVKDIDLSKHVQGENASQVTSGLMDRIDPTDKDIQRVIVVLNEKSVQQYPTDVVINNEDDLLQWVKWLNKSPEHTGNKNPIATFTNDITIDDELASEILKLDESYVLTIKAQTPHDQNNLRIAVKDLTPNEEGKSNADVLEYLDVDNGVTVEVMDGGTLNFTEKSYNIAHEIAAIPGYPQWCKGQMFIEVAEGGTLNILSNDKTAIQGGNDKTNTEAANKAEVYIENKGGYINVEGATRVLGINIVNEGEMVVAEGASIYFAPKSVNTIRGSIRVDGVISGTTNNNFVNKGVILIGSPTKQYSNGGIPEISNIINAGNDYQKMPGTIIFDNAAAKADLTSNTGIVDYQSYLNPVSFNTTGTGWTVDGVFKYTGAGKKVSELNKAYVSDADIKEGQLETDTKDAYLRNLIVRDGASVVRVANGNKNLQFAAFNNPGGLLEGTILIEGGATVNDVFFYNLNVLNALVDGTNGKQTKFTGEVAFCGHVYGVASELREYAGLYFKVANVLNEGKLQAGGLESVDGSKSTIDNPGEIQIPVGVTKDPQITTLKNDPKSVLNNPNPVQIQHPAGAAVITGEETLEEAFGKYSDMSLVTEIIIEGTINMSLEENKSQAAKLFTADRVVIFKAGEGKKAKLLGADALTAKALILKSDATISGPGKGNTMITVYTLNFGTSTLTASNGNIRIPIVAVEGNPCANIIFTNADQRVSVEGTSSVVSENGMWYDFKNKVWKD